MLIFNETLIIDHWRWNNEVNVDNKPQKKCFWDIDSFKLPIFNNNAGFLKSIILFINVIWLKNVILIYDIDYFLIV